VSNDRRTPRLRQTTWTVHELLTLREVTSMSLVRLLGFRTLTCGCVIGRYRELATNRELTYVEEKGTSCETLAHRRNHTVAESRSRSSRIPLHRAV
jgi:hypothetical protein